MIALIMAIIFFTVLLWSHFICWFHTSTKVLVLKKPSTHVLKRQGTCMFKKPGTSLLQKPDTFVLKATGASGLKTSPDGFKVILSFDAESFSDSDSTSDLLIFLLKCQRVPIQHKKNSTALDTKSESCFYYSFDGEEETEPAPRLTKSESSLSKRQ